MENKKRKTSAPAFQKNKRQITKLSCDAAASLPRENLKPGTLEAPLPAVMVTVGDMENSNIITVAWTGILSTNPPRAYISVRPTRHSHSIIESTGEFVINLTTDELVYETDYSGIYTGAKVDKFEKLKLTKKTSKCVQCPTIGESPLSLECRVFEKIESGTHNIFLADVLNISTRADIVDKEGKVRLDLAGLVAYAHGEYFALGQKIGEFGFSAAKKGNPKAKYLKNRRSVSKSNGNNT